MRASQQREDRLIDFAVPVMDLVESMPDNRAACHVAGQMIRSGTSPAPNHAEARGAESHEDFVHKMRIALKELRETHVWLRLVARKRLGGRTDPSALVASKAESTSAPSKIFSDMQTFPPP